MYPAELSGYFSHEGSLSLVITDDAASLGCLGRRREGGMFGRSWQKKQFQVDLRHAYKNLMAM